jgi:hypothetical protein
MFLILMAQMNQEKLIFKKGFWLISGAKKNGLALCNN